MIYKKVFLPIATVLCTSLLFSCTTTIEFPQPKFCQIGASCKPAISLEDCEKNNGEPKSSCILTCEIPEGVPYEKSTYSNTRPAVKCNGVEVNHPEDPEDRYNLSVVWTPSQLYFSSTATYTEPQTITVEVAKCNEQKIVCGTVIVR